ncbi:unnamed protein product [Pleuronectes platessa]|uniref:Uncharacterized protein n=1 Tax=Pleuronectes platessa TaxID=8262 RepID=A0A9N7TI94_PLEPL|nr:unnamed protein product [Pleuronectes platessa]
MLPHETDKYASVIETFPLSVRVPSVTQRMYVPNSDLQYRQSDLQYRQSDLNPSSLTFLLTGHWFRPRLQDLSLHHMALIVCDGLQLQADRKTKQSGPSVVPMSWRPVSPSGGTPTLTGAVTIYLLLFGSRWRKEQMRVELEVEGGREVVGCTEEGEAGASQIFALSQFVSAQPRREEEGNGRGKCRK